MGDMANARTLITTVVSESTGEHNEKKKGWRGLKQNSKKRATLIPSATNANMIYTSLSNEIMVIFKDTLGCLNAFITHCYVLFALKRIFIQSYLTLLFIFSLVPITSL